ncbi:hypothetical protein MN608_04197 [Microdochium nivale]|nr:hypothetical protein MN608_04197 [Microdochium nivale]
MVRISLVIAAALAAIANATTCGWKFGACLDAGTTCAPVLPWCRDLSRCIGQCVSNTTNQPLPASNFYRPCGGLMPGGAGSNSCSANARCIPDPRVPGCGVACDGAGICVSNKARACGGLLGLQCGPGRECFSDPTDSCDPNAGGADCPGICLVPLTKTKATTTAVAAATPTSTSGSMKTRAPRWNRIE